MGEMVSITIGSYDFISYKNTFGDLLTIFSTGDRRMREIVEDGESYTEYAYVSTVGRVKKSLDCLGYTFATAKKTFENSKRDEIEYLSEYFDEKFDMYDCKTLEREFTFEKWCEAAQQYALILSQDCFESSTCEYKGLEEQRKRKDLSVSEIIVLNSLPFDNNEHFLEFSLNLHHCGKFLEFCLMHFNQIRKSYSTILASIMVVGVMNILKTKILELQK